MPGAPDPLYVLARRTLLDALEALGDQRDAVILVGAQAIYLHTGEADLAVAPYTTDSDLVIDPAALRDKPLLAAVLEKAHLTRSREPGIWFKETMLGAVPVKVEIDFLVPGSIGGKGRRSADLGKHGRQVARKVKGLEAALVDRSQMPLAALVEDDPRRFVTSVAGPAALLVAKLHKIADRATKPSRIEDKDALDVLRLLRKVPSEELAARLAQLSRDEMASTTTRESLGFLQTLFGLPTSAGTRMAVRATSPLEPAATIEASCVVLAKELLGKVASA